MVEDMLHGFADGVHAQDPHALARRDVLQHIQQSHECNREISSDERPEQDSG